MIWKELNYFRKHENWGEPEKLSDSLLFKIDNARAYINSPFIITCGTQGKHKSKLHGEGLALDFIILSKKHPIDLLISIERFDFGGIGYYPHWQYNGRTTGGWHVDVRTVEEHQGGARWMGVLGENGKQKYVSLSLHNLKKYGVLKS